MFLHVSVILFTAGVCYPSMHCRWYPSMPCRRGVPTPGGCLLWRWRVGGACSQGGACSGGSAPGGAARGVWRRPRKADSYHCGRYASYRNAFLFIQSINQVVYSNHIFLLSPGNDGGGNVSNRVCLITDMGGWVLVQGLGLPLYRNPVPAPSLCGPWPWRPRHVETWSIWNDCTGTLLLSSPP